MRTLVAVCVGVLVAGWALASPVPEGAKWITIKGQVVWPADKPIPERKEIELPKRGADVKYTLLGGAIFDDKLIVHSKSRGVRNVVVWLRPDNDKLNHEVTFPKDSIHPDLLKREPVTHTVTSEFCRYDKRVLAVRVGDKLQFVNAGRVADNVRLASSDVDHFNVVVMPDMSHMSKPLGAERHFIRFESHIHRWMEGAVRVFDHPYYAITDEAGRFEIKQVPAGKWRIVYWTENGWHKGRDGARGFPLDVKGGAMLTLTPVEYELPNGK